jgi:Flp pilus assembly protein TadD
VGHSDLRDWDSAIEVTCKSLELEPDSLVGMINLAYYRLCLGDVHAAQRMLQEILSSHPKEPTAIENLGWVHYILGQTAEAEVLWAQAHELKPSLKKQFNETKAVIDDLQQQGRFAGARTEVV